MDASLSKKEDILLRVSEVIDTSHLAVKRRYSAYLTTKKNWMPVDEVIWEDITSNSCSSTIHKTIYVRLHPDDLKVDDLTKTKAFFRAKITLRLAGDKA